MKVISFGLLFFATSTHSYRHDGHHFARHEAERVCADDMNRLCNNDVRDPFMEWWMSPEAMPPPLMRFETEDVFSDPFHESNIESLINRMFDVALNHNDEGSVMTLFIIDEAPEPVDLLDSMIGKLFEGAQDPDVVAQNVQNVGESLLEQDGGNDHIHLARRLLEYNGDNHESGFNHRIQHHSLFGCPKIHECLVSAHVNHQLSPPCDTAMTAFQVQKLQRGHRNNLYHSNSHSEILHDLAGWFLVFIGVMFVTLCILIAVKKSFLKRKGDRALKRRILQAIYSNPELKTQVEGELGEPIGTVPPFKFMRKNQECRKRKLVFAVALTSMIAASFCCPAGAPMAALLIGLALLMRYIIRMKKRTSQLSKCSCCCCGGSPGAVESGNVSKAQACCSCCKGTGVCSVSCADCCGTAKATSAGCTCCCCGLTAEAVENGNVSELQACCSCCKGTGVCCGSCAACCGKGVESSLKVECHSSTENVGVMDGACSCCCCGLSTEDVINDCVSELQACCPCCKGTGVCSDLCAKCCTSGGCDDCGAGCDKDCCCGGKTNTRDPKLIVYQGVPVQIV